MKAIKKAVVSTGKYTNRSGEEKNSYLRVGTLFKNDQGQVSMKLEAMPVGEFSGWVNFYDLDEQKPVQQQSVQPQGNDLNDDIPF